MPSRSEPIPQPLVIAAALAACAAFASPPRSSDLPRRAPDLLAQASVPNTHLIDAAQLYDFLEYESSLVQLRAAEARTSSQAELAMISLYTGVIYANLPDKHDASVAAFTAALRLWPEARLPIASQKISREYEALKASVAKEGGPAASPGRALNTHLVEASRYCGQLEYENALPHLASARAANPSRAELAMISLYEGLIWADTPGKRDASVAAFTTALGLWPDAPLPLTSPKVELEYQALKQRYDQAHPRRRAAPSVRAGDSGRPAVSEDAPWFAQWYVWAGVAAAAAVTGVAVAAASQPGSPCAGGLCDFCVNGSGSFCP